MRVIEGIEAAQLSRSVLSIGNFDGLHLGHHALLSKGLEVAKQSGTELVVMTFEPHPAAILTPDRVPSRLTPLEEKLALLEAAGVNAVVVVKSQPAFFHISAEDFIKDIIVDRFHPVALIEGDHFNFGARRRGNIDMLRAAGTANGFEVHTVSPVRAALGGHQGTVISSSLIRHLIASGNVDQAATCLGRPYALLGTIQHGAGRGRTLGFPTANLIADDQLIPAEGVYAGRAFLRGEGRGARDEGGGARGEGWKAAISIGRTPTFVDNQLLVEVYLLDFSGDLYERAMRFEFVDWVRGQQRFSSIDELKWQIQDDVDRIRRILDAV